MMLVQQCCLYKRIFSKFKIRAKLCISAQQYSFAEMVHGREDFEIQKTIKKKWIDINDLQLDKCQFFRLSNFVK